MKKCRYKKGFTLIELLVVVLIIGILAAIALPQYQRAVEKARAAEAVQNVKLIEECFDWYILEHGLPANGIIPLADMNCPIEINLGNWDEEEGVYMTRDFDNYNPACTRTGCYSEIRRFPSYNYLLGFTVSPVGHSRTCYTQETDIGRYICNSIRDKGWEYADYEF